jgi:hypothetical protein
MDVDNVSLGIHEQNVEGNQRIHHPKRTWRYIGKEKQHASLRRQRRPFHEATAPFFRFVSNLNREASNFLPLTSA